MYLNLIRTTLFFKCIFNFDIILGPCHLHKLFLPSAVKAEVSVNGSCSFRAIQDILRQGIKAREGGAGQQQKLQRQQEHHKTDTATTTVAWLKQSALAAHLLSTD